ncbi:MAG: DUF5667 domain-containing protein [bacterium]
MSYIYRFALVALLAVSTPVFAQTDISSSQPTDTAALETTAETAADLSVADPTVLPDSSFYVFKNFGRTLRESLTFNPVKKAELQMQYANERLVEAQKMVELKGDSSSSAVQKATEQFSARAEKLEKTISQLKEQAVNNPEAAALLEKWTTTQLKHQAVLGALENNLPIKVAQKIKEVRERQLKKFVINLSETGAVEQLQRSVEREQKPIQALRKLELLKELEGQVSSEAKQKLEMVTERAVERFEERVNGIDDPAKAAAIKMRLEARPLLKAELLKVAPAAVESVESGNLPKLSTEQRQEFQIKVKEIKDRAEDIKDRREDVRDRIENKADKLEDVKDRAEDVLDKANVDRKLCIDRCQRAASGSSVLSCEQKCVLLDKKEDVVDRKEDVRDKIEDIKDVREDIKDRAENKIDRVNQVDNRVEKKTENAKDRLQNKLNQTTPVNQRVKNLKERKP